MILPYHIHQAFYFALSLVMVVTVWRLLRRLAKEPLRRLLWSVGGLGILMLAVALYGGFAPGGANTSGFVVIALAFYAFGIILPLFGLAQVRRSKLAAALSLVALGVAAWAMFVEPNRLQERRSTIVVDRFAGGRPIRIAHISDLQTVGHCAREDLAQYAINAFEPDLILFAGDYIAGPFEDPKPAMAAARSFLAGLQAKLGIVVVDGHAEPSLLRKELFEGLDVIHLQDQEKSFELADGRRIRVFGSMVHEPALDRLKAPTEPNDLLILLSHMPDQSMELHGRGVDIHLAGHTHGGQIAIPGFGAPLTLSAMPRRFARGLHRYDDHWLNVSAGIGMEGNHAPRVRLFCPPEICLLEIHGGQKVEDAPKRRDGEGAPR